MKRLQGYNVLYPMGWDAFGAPAEEYAIKNHIHPKEAVTENIHTFKRQMQTMGFSFDWSREFSTTDPEYYKWTQWQFLQFVKHDMAYKAKVNVNVRVIQLPTTNSNNNNSGNFNSKQKYAIKSVNSGKALDVNWGSKNDGANVLQYTYHGYTNQKWYLERQGDGSYVIKCANSNKVLDVAWASRDDGANVQQCSYNGNSCQKWELRRVGNSYAIINKNSGKALDVSGRSTADNANVLQWRYTGANNQLWNIEAVY
jgi:hypothetical protein